jgi:hypothetical protein
MILRGAQPIAQVLPTETLASAARTGVPRLRSSAFREISPADLASVAAASAPQVARMEVADELRALNEKLDQLEQGPAVVGDWHRFEARVARALICAHNQLLQSETRALRDALEELQMLRLCAQGRLLEYEAEDVLASSMRA